jgi:hypothetical protein
MRQPAPTTSSSSFVLTIAAVVAVCGGLAALGIRDRREAEARAVDPSTAPPPPPVIAPLTGLEVEEPPATVLHDPKAEPTTTLRGKVSFDANRYLTVRDEEADRHLVLSPEQLELRLVRFHRDEEQKAYWLDLDDGTRVELDAGAAKTLAESLPTRFTYGAQRAGDPQPEMLGDAPNPLHR